MSGLPWSMWWFINYNTVNDIRFSDLTASPPLDSAGSMSSAGDREMNIYCKYQVPSCTCSSVTLSSPKVFKCVFSTLAYPLFLQHRKDPVALSLVLHLIVVFNWCFNLYCSNSVFKDLVLGIVVCSFVIGTNEYNFKYLLLLWRVGSWHQPERGDFTGEQESSTALVEWQSERLEPYSNHNRLQQYWVVNWVWLFLYTVVVYAAYTNMLDETEYSEVVYIWVPCLLPCISNLEIIFLGVCL